MRASSAASGLAMLALAACSASATIRIGATTPVVYQAPPPARVERVIDRAGYFWITGRWDWDGNASRWAWLGGRWEHARPGYAWQPGAWTRRGNTWHWIEGRWIDNTVAVDAHVEVMHDSPNSGQPTAHVALYPTSAPPPPRVEAAGPARAGSVFVAGRWDWRAGEWTWLDGRWEPERAGLVWHAGRWQLQGTYYVWIEGGWGPATR